jgi:hypothetical protein
MSHKLLQSKGKTLRWSVQSKGKTLQRSVQNKGNHYPCNMNEGKFAIRE